MDWLNTIWHSLSANEFFQGGMVIGLITWLGYQLKTVPIFLWNKIRYHITYTVHFDQTSDFYRVFSEWLNESYPQKFRNVEVRFNRDARPDYQGNPAVLPAELGSLVSKSEQERIKIEKRQFTDANAIFYKHRWLWISKDRKEVSTTKDLWSLFFNSYSITGIFAKRAIESLCQEIADRRNAERQDDAILLGINEGDWFSFRPQKVVKPLSHIFFADKEGLLSDLEEFISRRGFYKDKGIKFKRSYLLYGRGGTGKTSIALGIAKHLGYDTYAVNLASLQSDRVLQTLSRQINPQAVVLIEDIDTILEQREVKSDSLNFGTVLNFLDGIYSPSDCIFVMTTNKPEALDEALLRKGRVDLALHIDYPRICDVEDYMSDFYGQEIMLSVYNENVIDKPMAEIQDICLKNNQAGAVRLVADLVTSAKAKTNGYVATGI
jgi:ATPase family protein associated with various cellular activities (AAA)